ncbi:MAG TPA: trigger factor [Terriglobia bacterium]|nr:trigger factor [Terriglobia bacterium]
MEAETCKRELVIEIPPDVVRKESETIAADFARKAQVPGFRRGRVPRDFILRRFRDAIREEVAQSLLPKFFDTAVKEQHFSVVGQPSFQDLKFEEDQPLTARVAFEVLPEIDLGDYKGIEATEEEATVTDAEVDEAIEHRREDAATYEVVDRPAEDSDLLSANYQGHDTKAPASRLLEVKDGTIRLGEEGTLPQFSENLRGVRAGETREFEIQYAADFPEPRVAGKTVRFRVEVTAVKHKAVPALDDELAKTVSEFATLDELRASLRQEIEKRKRHRIEAESKQKLLDTLAAQKPFPVPEALIEARLEDKLKLAAGQLIDQGIDPRKARIDWPKLRAGFREDAVKDVRNTLILEKVAEAEKIEISPEEIDEVIRGYAAGGDETPATIKTRLTENGGLARLQSSRRNQKALDFLYRNAKIVRPSSLAAPSLPAGAEKKHEQE